MIKSEESYLNSVYLSLKEKLTNKTISEVFDLLKNLKIDSLQNLYIDKDIDFLHDISDVLSVVTNIVTKPLLTNTSNEIIVRSGTANNLTNEDFLKTVKDSRMWKQTHEGYIPKEVYFREYIDEIKIYENYLIVQLINLIAKTVDEYSTFCSSLIKHVSIESPTLTNNHKVNDILEMINKINRKLRYIKSTYFYKVINKEHYVINNIKATNILLDNRQYNLCYRFYSELIRLGDRKNINNKLTEYYFTMMLQTLSSSGYKYSLENEKEIFDFHNKITLTNNNIDIGVCVLKDNLICLDIYLKEIKHLTKVCIICDHDISQINENLDNYPEFKGVNFLSIWNYGYIENNKLHISNIDPIKAEMMLKHILDEYTYKISGNNEIYNRYCPCCKSNELFSDDDTGIYKCPDCQSEYVLKDDEIIFIKLRRLNK